MRLPRRPRAAGFSINLTPMIDVVFNLLIFFMLATRFADMERQFDVQLPTAGSAQPLTNPPDEIVVNVFGDGRLVVGQQPMSPQQLETHLLAAHEHDVGWLQIAVYHAVGMRVVKSFNLEDIELASFQEINHRYLDRSLALARLRGSMGPMMQSLSALGIVIIFLYGGHLVLTHEISAAGFVAFFWSIQRLMWPLIALG